mmetsp:Transcript_26937/g.81273  ORF Transcript_26937/g.81273 Transcript_26937/m.81273 type:complete len:285 (+) Transcript_26937:442-1296(+)
MLSMFARKSPGALSACTKTWSTDCASRFADKMAPFSFCSSEHISPSLVQKANASMLACDTPSSVIAPLATNHIVSPRALGSSHSLSILIATKLNERAPVSFLMCALFACTPSCLSSSGCNFFSQDSSMLRSSAHVFVKRLSLSQRFSSVSQSHLHALIVAHASRCHSMTRCFPVGSNLYSTIPAHSCFACKSFGMNLLNSAITSCVSDPNLIKWPIMSCNGPSWSLLMLPTRESTLVTQSESSSTAAALAASASSTGRRGPVRGRCGVPASSADTLSAAATSRT